MRVLDSDFLIDVLNNEEEAIFKVHEIMTGEEPFVTTVINAQEVLVGAFSRTKSDLEVTLHFLQEIPILDYTFNDSIEVSQLQNHLLRKGSPIGNFDGIIAGICLAHHATLVTRNKKHFSCVPGLNIEEW